MVLMLMAVVSPVPLIDPIVGLCIHHLRLDHDDRGLRHDYRRWLDEHGLRDHDDWRGKDCDGERQPHPNGDMQTSCVCRQRQRNKTEETYSSKRS